MAEKQTFSETIVSELQAARILGVRAGTDHRWTGVWPVVVDGRLFVRSWNDAPSGWYRAFLATRDGSIQVGAREIPVRARPVRSTRLRDAVTAAYGQKYPTKGSRKWVEGFAEPERARNTLELLPQ